MSDLPPHVARRVQRILDAEARRILADKLGREITDPGKSNPDPTDDPDDESESER